MRPPRVVVVYVTREHPVTGTGMDAGLVFLCRWVALDDCPPLWGEADPLVEELRRSITKS